jgi:hypothetical protein
VKFLYLATNNVVIVKLTLKLKVLTYMSATNKSLVLKSIKSCEGELLTESHKYRTEVQCNRSLYLKLLSIRCI